METLEFFLLGPLRLSTRLVFWNRDFLYCIVPGSQILQGHVIILPKRRVLTYGELENQEVCELGSTIKILTRAMEKNLKCTSTTIYFQEYKKNQDENEYLNHFHVHLISRKKGDFENNDSIYKFLADHDKE
jgi:diadenosine tetraphosphate (Ap4A) HIT family hydrolase